MEISPDFIILELAAVVVYDFQPRCCYLFNTIVQFGKLEATPFAVMHSYLPIVVHDAVLEIPTLNS